jgi:hypothetical protein
MSRAAATRPAAASRGRRSPKSGGKALPVEGYLAESERPLAALVFLLPQILAYEVGTRVLTTGAGAEWRIVAFSLIERFFALFGVVGQLVPAVLVVATLLACHAAKRERWSLRARVPLLMAVESVALALPLVLIGGVMMRYLPGTPSLAAPELRHLVSAFGAGIYEEFLFRLAAFAGLHFLFVDVGRMREGRATLLIVCVTSLGFAGYHYLGNEPFGDWRVFAFRSVAGAMFGWLYLLRGFGVTAGAHTAYDLIIVSLRRAVGP